MAGTELAKSLDKSISFLFFVILLSCLFYSGFTDNFKTALGNDSIATINNNSSSWPMFHNDLAHSGYTATAGPLTNQTLWSIQTGPIRSSPTVAGGIVYVGLNDDKLLALNAINGAVLWSYQTGGAVYSTPAIADGVVYFGSWDNSVYALNALTGAVLWNHKTGSYVQSSPAVANGVVYVASYDANISALDAATGTLLWSFRTGAGAVGSSPAVVNGMVYVGTNAGKVVALNAATGTAIWSFTAGDTVYSSPTVANGVVYIGGDLTTDGTVYALNAATGAKLWSFSTGNLWVDSTPAVANGVVYVGSYDHLTSSNSGLLYALDASTGEKLWSYPIGTEVTTSPIMANNIVYAGGNHNFYALNASTGAKLWSYQIDTPSSDSWLSAAIANSILYVGFEEGILFAFGSSNETPSSPTPTPNPTPIQIKQANATLPVMIGNGKTVNLILSGNITSTQMSNVTIAANNATTTGLFFTVTGESGTLGFSNITIPKNIVPLKSTPLIFMDGQPAQSQGYTQDTDNYYVWYTIHFSTHQITIMFTSTTSHPTSTATNGQTNWLQIFYGIGAAMVIVVIVVGGIYLVISGKRSKS
jgi:outer membrane protein assembly factor BamB